LSKSKNHRITLTASQFATLTKGADFAQLTDEDGTLRFCDVILSDVKVVFLHSVKDNCYTASVPRCIKSNKAIKAIAAAV
jgi:hypothetical protein